MVAVFGPGLGYAFAMTDANADLTSDGPTVRLPDRSSVNIKLIEACTKFVTLKYRIDDFLDFMWQRFHDFEAVQSVGVDWLTALAVDSDLDDLAWLTSVRPDIQQLEVKDYSLRYSLDPLGFVTSVLPPFSFASYRRSDLLPVRVDSSLTIGSSCYRDWSDFIQAGEEEDFLSLLNARLQTESPGYDTSYTSVGRLPLYISREGKNRARMFKKFNRDIWAWTTLSPFPEAVDLQLCRIENASPGHVKVPSSCLIHDLASEKFHAIALPSIAIPVLEAYGVPWGLSVERDFEPARRFQEDQRRTLSRLVDNFNRP
jgi:hypothetical protein